MFDPQSKVSSEKISDIEIFEDKKMENIIPKTLSFISPMKKDENFIFSNITPIKKDEKEINPINENSQSIITKKLTLEASMNKMDDKIGSNSSQLKKNSTNPFEQSLFQGDNSNFLNLSEYNKIHGLQNGFGIDNQSQILKNIGSEFQMNQFVINNMKDNEQLKINEISKNQQQEKGFDFLDDLFKKPEEKNKNPFSSFLDAKFNKDEEKKSSITSNFPLPNSFDKTFDLI